MSEKALERRVKEYLNEVPDCWHVKIHGHHMQDSGLPDIIGCCDGNFFAIELKTLDGEVSKLQEIILKKINRTGGTAIVARSLETVQQMIADLR